MSPPGWDLTVFVGKLLNGYTQTYQVKTSSGGVGIRDLCFIIKYYDNINISRIFFVHSIRNDMPFGFLRCLVCITLLPDGH